MTERLYYTDPALLSFTATITAVDKHDGRIVTVLDRSAFYPTSGGQLHDLGLLNDVPVVEVIESPDGDVWHISECEVGKPGQEVQGEIEARRRRNNRCIHTAQHILSAVFKKLADLDTVSVHLGLEYGAIEFETSEISDEILSDAERLANEMIGQNLPIHILTVDSSKIDDVPLRRPTKRKGKIRVIQIGDLDFAACGGTHCLSTSEVGLIKIIGAERLRKRALVKYLAGPLALVDYQERFDATDALSRSLTCHVRDLPERVERLTSENKELKHELVEVRRAMIPQQVEELAELVSEAHGQRVIVASVSFEMPLMNDLAAAVADKIGGLAVLEQGGRLSLVAAEDSSLHAGNLAHGLAKETGLKGGGNKRLANMGGADVSQLAHYREVLLKLMVSE